MYLNTAIIGLGYWGKNLLRNVVQNNGTAHLFLCDTNGRRITEAAALYKITDCYDNTKDVFNKPEIDCVIIATSTDSHYELAVKALTAGKHVLVEKPITTSVKNARHLIALAAEKNLILMVDHIYLYNPVVVRLKEFIKDKEKIGNINYIDATRINLGIYQTDVNVLWDLACHDISIINFLIDEKPKTVRAIGKVNPAHGVEDIAYLFLNYPSGLLVQINSSWASPVKMRKMIIGGEKQMIIYDDIEPSNKLIIYDYEQNITVDESKNRLTDYRLGNVTIPKYEPEEPLKNVVQAFYTAIQTGLSPLANGNNALEVVRILECAQESLRLNSSTIAIH